MNSTIWWLGGGGGGGVVKITLSTLSIAHNREAGGEIPVNFLSFDELAIVWLAKYIVCSYDTVPFIVLIGNHTISCM